MQKLVYILTARFFTTIGIPSLYAQDRSNKGKEFWLGYGHDALFTHDDPVNAQNLVLYLSAESAANVTVSVNDGTALTRTTNTPFYHKYSIAGTFVVKLTVMSSLGCTSLEFPRTVIVAGKPVATAMFTGSPCVDNKIVFTFSYTDPLNTSWYWNFADGNTVTHTYTLSQANITVKHTVSIGMGCTSDTASIIIPLINTSPVASFSIKKDTLCVAKPITFSSTLTGISSWNWDFGNGTGSSVPPFTHAYTQPGNYPISLKVIGSNSCTSTPATDILHINARPAVNAGADKLIQTNSPVLLDASVGPAAAYTYLWLPASFLNSATALNPITTPDKDITYTLRAEDMNTHCVGMDNVTVGVVSKLYIPTAFTPNGDGRNDTWIMPGMLLYPDGMVTVYNRYGQKIVEKKNYTNNPWDGKFKPELQPAGTYVYVIALNDPQKQIIRGRYSSLDNTYLTIS